MEFAIVLFVNRRNEGTIPEETKEISSLNFPDDSMTTNERKKIEVLKNGWMQKPSIFNSFDRISIFAFPMFFIVFNVIYFIIYL